MPQPIRNRSKSTRLSHLSDQLYPDPQNNMAGNAPQQKATSANAPSPLPEMARTLYPSRADSADAGTSKAPTDDLIADNEAANSQRNQPTPQVSLDAMNNSLGRFGKFLSKNGYTDASSESTTQGISAFRQTARRALLGMVLKSPGVSADVLYPRVLDMWVHWVSKGGLYGKSPAVPGNYSESYSRGAKLEERLLASMKDANGIIANYANPDPDFADEAQKLQHFRAELENTLMSKLIRNPNIPPGKLHALTNEFVRKWVNGPDSPYNSPHPRAEDFEDPQGLAIPHQMKEAWFIARRPGAGWHIGEVAPHWRDFPHDISSNAARFANMGEHPGSAYPSILGDLSGGKGGEVNAFRHALWQATIANRYGIPLAKSAGDAHEDDPLPNLMKRRFQLKHDKDGNPVIPEEADTIVDELNNPIGRFVGQNTLRNASMRDIAEQVLEYYHDHGLWVLVLDGKQIKVRKKMLSSDKYLKLKSALERKDENGEWKN